MLRRVLARDPTFNRVVVGSKSHRDHQSLLNYRYLKTLDRFATVTVHVLFRKMKGPSFSAAKFCA